MQTSLSISELAAALAKAQGRMTGAFRDSVNPHFKSRYSDLESVWSAIRAPLSENGLSVVQGLSTNVGNAVITTRLIHVSGQWIEDELELPVQKPDAQGYGSAYTYGRRYALMAICGISPTDDDGNAAVGGGAEPKAEPKAEPRATLEAFTRLIEAARTPAAMNRAAQYALRLPQEDREAAGSLYRAKAKELKSKPEDRLADEVRAGIEQARDLAEWDAAVTRIGIVTDEHDVAELYAVAKRREQELGGGS